METMNLTVRQFCDTYNLSLSTFYRLKRAGKGPRIMQVGKCTFILKAWAKEWADSLTEN